MANRAVQRCRSISSTALIDVCPRSDQRLDSYRAPKSHRVMQCRYSVFVGLVDINASLDGSINASLLVRWIRSTFAADFKEFVDHVQQQSRQRASRPMRFYRTMTRLVAIARNELMTNEGLVRVCCWMRPHRGMRRILQMGLPRLDVPRAFPGIQSWSLKSQSCSCSLQASG